MPIARVALTVLALIAPSTALAQFEGIGSVDPFSINVSPEYPAPHASATLSFISSNINLDTATLTVSTGGEQVYKGNVQPVTVPTGRSGSVTIVSVLIKTPARSYSDTVTIQPQDVALVVEPIASVPPLYPGKPLVPLDGTARVIALANFRDAAGKTLDPSSLIYSWTVDGAYIANSSGVGRTSIIVASPLQYRVREVSVAVQSSNGALVGGGALSLTATEPTVRVYEYDALLGIRFDHALAGVFPITGSETALYAAPFSFPLLGGGPQTTWTLNGATAEVGSSLTLRPAGEGEGSAMLVATAIAGDSARASTDLTLTFGTKQSSFFGI